MDKETDMAKKKTEEEKKPTERWRGRWPWPKDFPEKYFDLLDERYDVIERCRGHHSMSSSVPMFTM